MSGDNALKIEKSVTEIINEVIGSPKNSANIKSTRKDLAIDSVDSMEILLMLEEKFEIEISDEVAEGFSGVQSIVDFCYECKY